MPHVGCLQRGVVRFSRRQLPPHITAEGKRRILLLLRDSGSIAVVVKTGGQRGGHRANLADATARRRTDLSANLHIAPAIMQRSSQQVPRNRLSVIRQTPLSRPNPARPMHKRQPFHDRTHEIELPWCFSWFELAESYGGTWRFGNPQCKTVHAVTFSTLQIPFIPINMINGHRPADAASVSVLIGASPDQYSIRGPLFASRTTGRTVGPAFAA